MLLCLSSPSLILPALLVHNLILSSHFLREGIELLRPHSFIATEQALFYAARKATLKTGEFLVTADFSENYSSLRFARRCPRVPLEQLPSNLAPLCRLLPGFRRGMPSELCGDY